MAARCSGSDAPRLRAHDRDGAIGVGGLLEQKLGHLRRLAAARVAHDDDRPKFLHHVQERPALFKNWQPPPLRLERERLVWIEDDARRILTVRLSVNRLLEIGRSARSDPFFLRRPCPLGLLSRPLNLSGEA